MADVLAPRFDGFAIDQYAGRFNGAFDVENVVAAEHRMDDEVYFVVRAKVKSAVLSETKTGDIQRTNVYTVTDATLIENGLGYKLQTMDAAQLQLSFTSDLLDDEGDEFEDDQFAGDPRV